MNVLIVGGNGVQMKFNSVRASTLASWFWCSEKCGMSVMGLEAPQTEAMFRGRDIHRKMERALTPEDVEFREYLNFPLRAEVDGIVIIGTPDDIIISDNILHDKKVLEVVEIKSAHYVSRYVISPATFQLLTYAYLLEKYLPYKNYIMSRLHRLIFIDSKSENIILDKLIPYDTVGVEKQIVEILKNLKSDVFIPCQPFKCKQCPDIYKRNCITFVTRLKDTFGEDMVAKKEGYIKEIME